ncbi:MAG: hypothetical protein HYS80_02555, partial [Candidatus Aenigmarchaeota archaeon]|nr:hypothetical protein [Candidatus Aenigmarchaeota archaeon]
TYGVTGTITVEPPQPKWAFRKILDALGTIFRGRNSESYCVFVQSADQAAAIIDPEIRSHEMNRKLPVNSYCNNCHGQVNGTISREA